tara:strand:- start:1206 stop:2582 length:1377 start_codon:yes stop_codon:yes gene_type:complete
MIRNIFILYLLGIIKAQELPYGMPRYFEIEVNQPIKRSAIRIQEGLKNHFFDEINPIIEGNQHLYYFEIILEKDDPIHFKIFDSTFHKSSTLYFIDIQNNGWVGPYTKDSFSNNDFILTGRMKTKNIVVELSISKNIKPKNPLGYIIHPKKMRSSNSMSKQKSINREPNNKILLTGYWPPSNEGIRSFSQNHLLNPNGWIGGNWENRGYDIVSYFPIFTDPDCESCGQGYGDLEVDYQDTSEDWWNIIDSINPIAIITFSRGYIDYSWELEWQYFNYFYWTADFTEPFYPTPAPPDSSLPINTRRYSSLPMDSIVSQIASSGLGLTPYIDYTQGAGAYLSEFMGYHGVWHKAKMDSANIPCIVAGHVHVGGLIDWDTAQQAVAITLREVIKVVDEYRSLPGDVDQDGVLSIYDMLEIIDHILGNEILDNGQLDRADINLDTHIDVFDLLLLSNLILDW